LQQSKFIVWDECTMTHKKIFESIRLHVTRFTENQNRFGGAMILLAGDFRQTLPVITRSTPADELNTCLKLSILWKYVKTLKLNMNKRIHLQINDQFGVFF
jgi:ATP-dependent DNA helicase PIF1